MQHSIYLHIPFCTHRCAYCDFNTYAGISDLMPAYVDALCHEVESVGRDAPSEDSVHTVFFGGGTPSLLSGRQVTRVLGGIRRAFRVEAESEITLEANPGTVALETLQEIRRAGVNRISLGVQSANGEELRMLERTHDFGDVVRSISALRRSGFENVNLDLIYGLPEQTLETWRVTLRRILDLHPEHISAYCLTLEHGTPFGKWTQRGLMPVPDADLAADMYEMAGRELEAAGFRQYEISNWALPGYDCRHNMQYWEGEPYLGFGAGAHGYANGIRYSNTLAIRDYIRRLEGDATEPRSPEMSLDNAMDRSRGGRGTYPCSPAAVTRHLQSIEDEMAEFMIMGLRLTDSGVGENRFRARFGRAIGQVYGPALARLEASKLIEKVLSRGGFPGPANPEHGDGYECRIRLTARGRLLGNRAFAEFVV